MEKGRNFMKRYGRYIKCGCLAAAMAVALTACQGKEAAAGASGAETGQQAENSVGKKIEIAPETGKAPGTGENEDVKGTGANGENGTGADSANGTENGNGDAATESTPLSLLTEIETQYEGEWQDGQALLRAERDTIHILEEGYENLKAALDGYNAESWEEDLAIYKDNLEFVKENPAQAAEAGGWYTEGRIHIQRADEKLLSFVEADSSYLGGAHGNYYRSGLNFDPATGKKLELADVVTDWEKLYEYVKEYLAEHYEQDLFFENYVETILSPMFHGDGDEGTMPLEWVMDQEKLTLIFNPYVLAPWASGSQEAVVPFADDHGLIKEEYRCQGPVTARKIFPEEEFFVDRDGDGKEECFHFSSETRMDEFMSNFKLSMKTESGELSESTEIYGGFSEAYLMYSESGHPYLYVEFYSDNDWRSVEILDLKKGDGEGLFKSVGGTGDSFYGHFVSDAGDFALFTRTEVLGTYMVYRDYYVGEDGLPVPKGEVYTAEDYMKGNGYSITSVRELPVTVEGKEEVLPAGTVFTVVRAGEQVEEGETFAEAKLSDGRICRLTLTKEKDRWDYDIDGVSIMDCFEDLHYAG